MLQIDNRNSKDFFEETITTTSSAWDNPVVHNMVSDVFAMYELLSGAYARTNRETRARNGEYPPTTGWITQYVNVTYNTRDKVPFFSANSSPGVQLGSGGVATASGGAAGNIGTAIPIIVGCTDYRARNYCPTCNADHKITGAQLPPMAYFGQVGGVNATTLANYQGTGTPPTPVLEPLPGSTSIGNEFTYCKYGGL